MATPSNSTLKRSLGFAQVALYGTGSMLGAGIYALIGKTAGTLGNAVWLAFAVAMTGALLTGLSYAAVGGRYPKAGGAAFVTQQAFGLPWLSYMVGIAVMMSGLTSMATGSQAIIEQLQKILLFADGWIKPGAIGLVLLIGAVIFRGIRESMWLNMLCTIVEAAGLLFIIFIGLRYWGAVDYLAMPTATASTGDWGTVFIVLQAAVLSFFSFIGFEDILNVSEEVKDPQKNVPRGLITAMLITTCIYMAVAITAVSVLPWAELAQSKSPLMDVAKKAAPWFSSIDKVYLAITIFAIGNTALLNYLMGSRLLYGMSIQALLPAPLSKIHPQRQTPHVAIVVLFFIVSLLILLANVRQMAEATVMLLLSVFTLVNLALLKLKKQATEPVTSFDVPAIVPLLGALVCATLIVVRISTAISSAKPDDQKAPLIAAAILAASMVLYQVVKPKKAVAE
jgi:basic amino acid/polyamine antiporter, APA family